MSWILPHILFGIADTQTVDVIAESLVHELIHYAGNIYAICA